MPDFAKLDEVEHADLRVAVGYADAPHTKVNQTLVFPTEFIPLSREYPIFFRKDQNGKFYAVVLLGLDRNENLFLDGDRWTARYVPAVIERGPFALAIEGGDQPGGTAEAVIHVDMDDPRVGAGHGERVFLPHGGRAPYLEAAGKVLNRIHVGAGLVDDFFDRLSALDLIEPLTLQASLGEDLQYTVPDIFTISRENMAGLSGDQLRELNQIGLLEHCFAIMASIDNFSKLVDLKAMQKKG
ncbi:SapC family protein [Henriciella sp. AS95]|uniref:SapC family protein n=1 Tax=Henriciella sp. AS95 TaxID=3135782 RepID=UPI00316C7948